MRKINDGGPAFPLRLVEPHGDSANDQFYPGMSIRDCFAMAALGALHGGITDMLVNSVHPSYDENANEKAYRLRRLSAIGATAYTIADQMLEARKAAPA